jgi:hypothetical protein
MIATSKRGAMLAAAVLGLAIGVAGQAKADLELITNGSFEAGGGSFAGWTVTNQAGGSGDWFVQSGTTSPLSGFPVPAPPEGTHAAMTDQPGPGSHVLIQDFVVPTDVASATLSFDKFVGNRDGPFATPNSLDFTVIPNQQARVDILTATANPFSVAPGDVLLNVFQTHTGDPTVDSGYSVVSTDLTSFLQSHAGQTLALRFAEVDNQLFFQFGVDSVSLDVTTVTAVPELDPSSMAGALALASGGLAVLTGRRRKRAAA